MAFADVPIIALTKGSMWNADLVLGDESGREWCSHVEFTHYNLYPREDAKCIVIAIKDLLKVTIANKLLRRWMESWGTMFRHNRRY